MRWRMEAKGYPAGQAWFRETTWVYGIGAVGYGIYLLFVLAYRLLGAPVPVHLFLFHGLVWGFFLLAHLPDALNSGGDRPGWRPREGIAPVVIALANLTLAFVVPNLVSRARGAFPGLDALLLEVGGQAVVIALAYTVHGVVNGVVQLGSGVRGRRPRPRAGRVSEPLWSLLEHLRGIPEGEMRPTLRLITAIALGSPDWLRTPVLLEGSRHQLFHPDGSINAVMLAQFLSRRSELRQFVPPTELGITVYRPLARRLSRGLRRVPAWRELSWTRITDAGWRKCAALLMDAPSDRAILLLCVCAHNVNRSRTMQKVLDHLVRRNALRLRVWVRSAGVEVGPDFDPSVGAVVRRDLLRDQNAALARFGIREVDWEPRGLEDAELRLATVILVADSAAERLVIERLRRLFPHHPDPGGRVVLFNALDPDLLGEGPDLPDPRHGEIGVLDSVVGIRSVLAGRVLPVLLAKTAQLSPSPAVKPIELELPPAGPATARVTLLRSALLDLKERLMAQRERGLAQRLVKLVWATAHRDPSILLGHGLSEALLEAGGERTTFEDGVLWQLWQNGPYLDEVVPSNRAVAYEPIARQLKALLGSSQDPLEGGAGVLPTLVAGGQRAGSAKAT